MKVDFRAIYGGVVCALLEATAAALRSRAALFAALVISISQAANALVPLDNIAKVVGGGVFTCALTNAGGVKCWGYNAEGQMGDGTFTHRLTPVDVTGLASGVAKLSVGYYHACVITNAGGLKCWGRNGTGQLGDNTTTNRPTPVDVQGLTSGVVDVTTGFQGTCALTTSGAVKCWGWNAFQQVGDGTTTDRLTPFDVPSLSSGVTSLAASFGSYCAVTAGAGVKCWGRNGDGELGNNTFVQSPTPVDVTGLASGVAQITGGNGGHCARTTGGGVKCWGWNGFGQLGDNSTATRPTPVDVSGLTSGVTSVVMGFGHTCALVTGGGLKCWGQNSVGQLGDNTTTDRLVPQDVPGHTSGQLSFGLGNAHSCAVPAAGTVACWGRNPFGQLGDGTLARKLDPIDVQGLSGVTSIGAGTLHTCAVTGGAAKCWGRGADHQLGNGISTDRTLPTDVTGLTAGTVASISTRGAHSCVVTTSGGAKCWGQNQDGGTGNNTSGGSTPTPADVTGLTTGVTAVTAGGASACALTTATGVKCWGNNDYGQLGDGSTTRRLTAVDVTGLTSGVAAIAAHNSFACALTTGGGVKCWGRNNRGQLGDGTTTDRPTPVDVSGLTSGVAAITLGVTHACALTTGGGVKCWGVNDEGELGDSTNLQRNTPVDVAGLASGVTGVFAGENHTCAIVSGGSVKCWGYNSEGQLGDLTTTDRRLPVPVAGLVGTATAMAGGGSHTCALLSGGAMKCWGSNGSGQLGDGTAAFRKVPAAVLTFNTSIVPATSMMRSHALALDATGKVFAWGSDSHGQLGQGRAINRSTPAMVSGIPSAVSHVSISQHVLAVDAFKQVWSWGENACGQLGPREAVPTSKPARVIGAVSMTKVASGGCFSLALKSDGTVWGWGLVPGYGSETGMRQLAGLAGVVEIAAGSNHALARTASAVFALGDNAFGQLGQGGIGAAQGAIAIAALAGASSVAAGSNGSAAIVGGSLYAWGQRPDGSVVSTPAALLSAGGPVAVSVSGSEIVAALTGGAVQRYTTNALGWQTVAGYAGITRVQAGSGFNLGIGVGGQVLGSGNNHAGQLGLGDTVPHVGVSPIASMTNVSMIVSASVNPSVIALKADGSLWFWGADTLGESGDGAAVGSSVPLAVTIPVAIRQVAVGDRFSTALDVNGDVWGWGDNGGAALTGSFVNSSAPARIPGVSNIQAIAAGGVGVMLYLHTDGTVLRSGSLIPGSVNDGAAGVSGLTNIVAIAAGTSGYALAANNTLYSFGANASGELGNGNTATSTTPVAVTGVSGTIASIAAGSNRAGAVTSDGKAWSWGGAPLGNGSASGSSTAVQVPGISDAAELSVGKLGSMVRRAGGTLSAWGDLGLDDGAAVNRLSPYPVAFHEAVKSAQLGRGNALGHIIGNTGLGWGFGDYPSISTTNASIGDGTYVRRTRPVVLLAAGGAGNIDTNNWYLDLVPSSAETVPATSTPKMLGVSQLSGSDGGIAFAATVKYKSADFGKSVNNYVFGLVPPAFFNAVKKAPGVSMKAIEEKAAKADGFVLAQLTPSGWMAVTGQLNAYSQGTANASGGAANILNGVPAAAIPGARFCIGYGESSGSMLSFNALREVLLLPGASQNTSGVPCVLTGVYVDGPPGSRTTTSVTFKASVVGLSPTGSVQFRDGAQALGGSLTIASANDAVAEAQMSTSTLAVGEHSIGATYFGDSQNAPISADLPVRHLVTAAATQANLVGPTSSDELSPVVFEATVIGANPTGTVQFKDGVVDLGAAVPLVGGLAALRLSTLALGDHAITAVYSGNGNNTATTSNIVAHKVVSVFTTRVTLTSSAIESVQGDGITLTATVTGVSPTGSVTFRDGTTVLGTANLVNGVATLTISSFTSGGHQITASYSGDGDDQAVSSPAIVQQVNVPAVFSMAPGTLAFGGQLRNTSSAPRAVTITNTGGAPLTVSSVGVVGAFTQTNNCATVAGGATCTIQVRFAPTALGAVNGSVTIQTSLGPNVVALTGTGQPSLVSHYYTSILRRAPDAGGQAFWDAEAVRVSALGVNVNEVWFAMAQAFYFSAEYAALNRDNTGFITDLYTTFFNRAPDQAGLDYWVGLLGGGMPREVALASFMFSPEFRNFAQAIYGNTAARAEVDAVTDFYRGLLARLPDDGGFTFWVGKFRTAQCQGAAAITAEVEAISSAYALSAEYTNRARTNVQYVGDLYNAFLRRGGDLDGVLFWINQVATAAQTREQVRVQFRNSAEFQARVAAIIAQGCL